MQKQTEARTKSSALKIHKCPIPRSVDDTSFTPPSSRHGLCRTVVAIRAAFSPYGVCRTILSVRHLPYTPRRWSLYNHRRTAFAVQCSPYGIRRTIIAIQLSTYGIRRTVLDIQHFAVQFSLYGVYRTKLVVRRSPHKARRPALAVLTSTRGMCAAYFPPYGVHRTTDFISPHLNRNTCAGAATTATPPSPPPLPCVPPHPRLKPNHGRTKNQKKQVLTS